MQLMHHAEFDISNVVSRLGADKFYKLVGATPTDRHVWWIGNIQDFLSDGEALYKHVYLHK